MGLNSFIFGVVKYCKFTQKELKNFFVTVIILGFIIGFKDNRITKGIDAYYIIFMLFSVLIVAFTVFLKNFQQRLWMMKFGQNPEYKYSINSLLIGIVLVFATEGFLWFLPSGHTIPHHLQGERIGKWRYGLKYVEHGRALSFGIMGLLFFAVILKFFESPDSVFLTHTINVIIAISIYSVLPLPENDGIYILYARRWLWVFTLALIVFTAVLIKLISSPWIILFGVIILSTIVTIIYNIKKQPLWFS